MTITFSPLGNKHNFTILMDEGGHVYQCDAPKGIVKSSVGAGDSMVAGFLGSYIVDGDLREAFCQSVAAGSASAFSTELATFDEICRLLEVVGQKCVLLYSTI